MNNNPDKLFKFRRRPDFLMTKKQQKRFDKTGMAEVTYPVSCRYNGGIILSPDGKMDFGCKNPKSKWYAGFEVPKPKVPKGYHLESIGVGLELNATPPRATMLLIKDKPAQTLLNP